MRRRLIVGAAYVLIVVVVGLTAPFAATLGTHLTDELGTRVEREAFAVAAMVEDHLERGRQAGLQHMATSLAARIGGRVLVTGKNGALIADSLRPPGSPPPTYRSRPEIARALRGHPNWQVRHSVTLGYDLMVSAVPIGSAGRVLGAVRISFPMAAVRSSIHRAWWFLAAVGLVTLVVGLGLATWLARWVTRPLREAAAVARRIGSGDLDVHVPEAGPPEVVELAGELNAMTDRLSDLLRSDREFAANASHQLRTPLTALRLTLEEAKEGPDPRGEIDRALHEADRLTEIVESLLQLGSSRERGGEMVDLARTISGAALGIPATAVTVETRGSGWVVADGGRVEQVVGNLVENAVRHARTQVRVTAWTADGHAGVVVEDDGPGVPERDRARVFDRFYRGRRPQGSGSGLGLAVAGELARVDGGSIELAESELGGARFEVVYDAAPDPAGAPLP